MQEGTARTRVGVDAASRGSERRRTPTPLQSRQVPDETDDELQLGLDNTAESWKRALVASERDARRVRQAAAGRERLILLVAAATLVVAAATLIVALVK